MKSKRQAEWQRDIENRQRNVVFPNTAENEARLWRNMGAGKWNGVIVAGLVLICLALAGALAGFLSVELGVYREGTLIQRTLQAFGVWIILLLAITAVLLIAWIVQRRKRFCKS